MNKPKNLDWRIWNKNDLVEERTYLRAIGKLPEMECAKQLRSIIKQIDDDESVLDVGCASGHYLISIRNLNKISKYTGYDATKKYIQSAKKIFNNDKNASFVNGDIYDLNLKADIVFCCNVLHHLPDLKIPLNNLLKSFKKKLIVRTLISEKTHLSQYLYKDHFDDYNNPTNFVFQNTYSFDYIKNIVNEHNKNIKLDFIEDIYDNKNILKEAIDWKEKQGFSITNDFNGLQIAGDKVFRWGWFICSRINDK